MQAFLKYTFGKINSSVLKRMALFTIPKSILSWCVSNNFQVSVELEKDRSHLPDRGRDREKSVMFRLLLSMSAPLLCSLVDKYMRTFLYITLPSQ